MGFQATSFHLALRVPHGMSIARTAPESFELQDLICVEIILRFGFERIERFLVEPKGGEDGALCTRGPDQLLYEIQVKAGAEMVTLKDLALWLTHFPERQYQDMLLERLIADPTRRLLVVVAGRASDALDPLIAPDGWVGDLLKAPPAGLSANLLAAFRTSAIDDKGTKTLHQRRVAHHAITAATISEAQVRDALTRIMVIDRAIKASVTDRISRRLRAWNIPDDIHADVMARLRAIVGLKRNGIEDLASAIEAQIHRDMPTSICPSGYVPGMEEAGWVELVRTQYCLLLSGVTRTGKSVAARWVASQFERQGARVESFASVEEAERFLMGTRPSLRVAVIDDPLGGVRATPEADRQLHRLEALIPRLDATRRLIIAQGSERLLEVAGASNLGELGMHGRQWIDTGGRSLDFLADLWLTFANIAAVSEPLISLVADALRNRSIQLEPGTLEFLANLPEAKSGTMSLHDAVRAALVDARTLSRSLDREARSPTLMRALAIGSSPSEPVAWRELAFIGGAGGDLLPTRSSQSGLSITFGDSPRVTAPLPDYSADPELDGLAAADLDMLERRHMVTTDAADRSTFAHPFYRAAAELLFRAPSRSAAKQMLAMHERALFSRSAATSRAAARSLDWLLERAGTVESVPQALFERAETGLKSLYPATRDLCFDFLQRHSTHPNASEIDIVAAGNRVASVELESLNWLEGQAIFPVDGQIRDTPMFQSRSTRGAAAMATALGALAAAGGSALTPEAAADTLLYLKEHPDSATVDHLASLMSYDEAVLRSEAAAMWLSRPRTDDEAVLERIFADPHPMVAKLALLGVIGGFAHCSDHRRARLIDGLLSMASSPSNAALYLQRLILFDRDPVNPPERPWSIFETLMPAVLEALPVSARFVEARLHNVMIDAGAALSAESMATICDRWVGWIERMNAAGRWLDDFSLGVLDILFQFVADRRDLRGTMVERVLALTITTSRLTVIKDAVERWRLQSTDERQALRACLTEQASDALWRQAVALTREEVAEDIEIALLPEGVRLADGHSSLRAAMPEALFAACVSVASGKPNLLGEWRPRPLPPVWKAAIEEIARDPHDPLFDGAFALTAADASRDDPAFTKILTAAAEVDANAVFEQLLQRTIYDGAIARAEQWRVLLGLDVAMPYLGDWLTRMAEVAHEVVYRATELQSWILDPILLKIIEGKLDADRKVYEALIRLIQLKEAAQPWAASTKGADYGDGGGDVRPDIERVLQLMAETIVQMIETNPPKFWRTISEVSHILKRHGLLTDALRDRLEAERGRLLSRSDAREEYLEARKEALPEGWVMS